MTSLRNTGTPSELMNRHANAIYAAVAAAELDGFKLVLKYGWAIDMVDGNGNSTPVTGILNEEGEYGQS